MASEYIPPTKAIVEGEPNEPFGDEQIPQDGPDKKAPKAKGPWLSKPEDEVAKEIDESWRAQDAAMKNRLARWDLNERRREGDSYSKLIYTTDSDSVRIYTPVGAEHAPPSLNKTDELCGKAVSNLLVDPPKAECEPSKDEDAARDAAEFSTRFLENESAESALHLIDAIDEAEDLACATGSAFIRFYVDPAGGGSRPKQIYASQAATTVEDALFVTVPEQPEVPESLDPMSGELIPGTPAIPGHVVPQPEPYVLRYVRDDDSLTDEPSEAAYEWLPAIERDVMTGRHIRFLPDTCSGIHDAEGVLIAAYLKFGRLKALFPKVEAMTVQDQRALVAYRPPETKNLLPKGTKDEGRGTSKADTDSPSDDAMVLTITGVLSENPEHPEGAYVVMAGGKFLLDRRPWCRYVTDPVSKKQEKRPNSLPVAQFRQFFSAKDRDPYGRGFVDKLIDGDPLLAIAIGSLVEYIYRANNPHIFVPIGSGISDKALSLPRGTPIPFNPAGGGKPVQEQIGQFSPEVMQLYELVNGRMDSVSGLEETAQGLDSENSQSGIAKQLVVEQALVALSRVKRGLESGFVRACRIILEQAQMAYTTPMMMKVVGDDGSFKYREWTAADLGTTVDVRIQSGTSTMLTPSAKSAIAMEKLTAGAISLEDYQEMERANMRTLIGAQDNPALLRVKRQINDWSQGPPKDWQPLPPVPDPMTGQPVAAPDPQNPFGDVLPSDEEQAIAKVRHYHIVRAMQGTKYQRQPEPWKALLIAEYQRMRYAAGVQTMAEQYQAQQIQGEKEDAVRREGLAAKSNGKPETKPDNFGLQDDMAERSAAVQPEAA